ncbi:MAG: DUF1015 domain-containing protein [Lachnospiraceae bacterium]|nr:DUF1015 domain-containing protein [Lachnospiraceae bacterium]
MAEIRPFKAYRPKEGLESQIASLPYDVFSRQEAKAYVDKHPQAFLRIDRAETGLPDEVSTYDPAVYERAKQLFQASIQKGEFVQDPSPCFYLYELTMEGRTQTGIVAVCAIDDYQNGIIKRHENTRADKEEDRVRHVDALNAHTGPIFLAYREREDIQETVSKIKKAPPAVDFLAEDGIRHRTWVLSQPEEVAAFQEKLSHIDRLYIADGHHRAASAVRVGEKRRQEHPGYTGEEEFNYFLSVIFPDSELKIFDYNRVVRDLNGLTPAKLLERISEHFEVGEARQDAFRPEKKGEFGLFLEGVWRKLCYKGSFTGNAVQDLDVSILQDLVLHPLLGIQDPKTDSRIDFIGGIRGLGEIERRCRTDMAVGFSMFPTSMEELFAVSDNGLLMPPKSTWFEPKLLSGLFIHEM